MSAWDVAASAISAVGNYFTTDKTNKANRELAEYQNAYNTEMYERQKADNIDMWNMQNEYNSPSAEMERLVAAGINPRGSKLSSYANAGNINTPQMQPAASYQQKQISAFSMFSDAYSKYLDLEKQQAEIDLIKQNTNTSFTKSQLQAQQYFYSQYSQLRDSEKHEFWRFMNGITYDEKGAIQFPQNMKNYETNVKLADLFIKGQIGSQYKLQNKHLQVSNDIIEDESEMNWDFFLRRLLSSVASSVGSLPTTLIKKH